MPKVSSMIVKFMKEKGCTKVFGIPGKPIVPLILAMEAEGVEFVLARHEGGAGYMATGYALQNQSLGVAIGTSGPGGTNMLTAAAQAAAFHAPVLFITGHPPLALSGKALGQDSSMFGTDLVELFKPVTKFSAKVESKEMLRQLLQHAEEQALTGSKGPVHLSVPLDILVSEIDSFEFAVPARDDVISGNIERAIQALEAAERPLLLLGKGAHLSGAYASIQELAERWQIPVVTTPGGKGAFVETHPLSLGALGLGGTEAAAAYVKDRESDLFVVIGSKLSDMSTVGLLAGGEPRKVIQFDWHAEFVGKSLESETILVQGDADTNLKQLLKQANHSALPSIDLSSYVQKETGETAEPETGRLSAARTVQVLRDLLPHDAIVYGDDGSHSFYTIKHFTTHVAGTFRFDDVFGAMGNGIGLAIGAKVAQPDQNIVCFTGDGCLFMHGTEIATAVDADADLLFVVFNNEMLDMVDKGMKYNLGVVTGTRYIKGINAAQFAESLGATGFQCATEAEITEAYEAAKEVAGPVVIEVLVNKEEVPPTLGRG
ncbi:thiamine pyrophosphate-binding protein [Alkalicoccobacillus porphyridii]|uniref:Thiamine pyrophosphate-binding protein n=1 Tax=Alkalicoccobacillus porphyridii TaxID=2597270 RepID=A0A554A1D9_9BACI|nr:thiamine pyrophosphate-binding protein [Alkalicoccobacillus porphyridii]TSB47495.1 thiamine pyrophosphate-binding protein [Alkalicoccobacillus porphyridii]